MASVYYPWPPSTGPGNQSYILPQFNTFQANNVTTYNGYGYTSSLGPNTTPNPGPPAPQTDNGILLEPSWNSFVALELSMGGPTDHLVLQP